MTMRKVWPFTFSFLFFASIASMSPFTVLYYQGLGFTGAQIGLLTSISPLVALFSAPLWAGLADATRRHRPIMSLALLVSVIAIGALPFLNTFWPVLLTGVLFSAFFAPVSSFADSATMCMLAEKKELYGRVRLGGTIGFGLIAPVVGVLVRDHGLKFAFWGCAALLFLAFIVSQKLVYTQVKADNPVRGSARTLLRNPRWLLFLTMAFASGLALAATNSYLSPYLKGLGADESAIGIALTMGTISEIPVLFFGNRLIKWFKPYGLFMMTAVVTGIRLLSLAASSTPILVLFSQLLNGLTFPAMWVAGVSYADENAPAGLNTTAQGLFGAVVMGFGNAVGGFTSGLLLESIGGRGLYFVFGAVVLAVTAIVALIHRRLPAG